MEKPFILTCESTVDVTYAYMQARDIPVIFYNYLIDGKEYVDDMARDPQALPRFYQMLADGAMPTTTQLNEFQYTAFFEEQLQRQPGDILHINFGSGMTASVGNAIKAAKALEEQHPGRRIVVVDSLCSSSGYGLLVDGAADLRDEGRSLDEIVAWLIETRGTIHHQFFATDLKYFRRGGRVSGATAMVATILGICPLMRLDDKGKIIAYDKVRGKSAAIQRTVKAMEEHALGGHDYRGKCWISHSHCPEDAERTRALIQERFPHLDGEVRIWDIGTIIASHTGPGTVAVFFYGDARAPYPEK